MFNQQANLRNEQGKRNLFLRAIRQVLKFAQTIYLMNAKQIFMGLMLTGALIYFVFFKYWDTVEDIISSPLSLITSLLVAAVLFLLVRRVVRS